MQPPSADQAPSSHASSFAGLLAALADAQPKAPRPSIDDWRRHLVGDLVGDLTRDLDDDETTFTRGRTLQARTEPEAADSWTFSSGSEPHAYAPASAPASQPGSAAETAGPRAATERAMFPEAPAQLSAPGKPDRPRKRASVTVRLSQTEYMQLQQRAAEAGVTVSTYLRSCTFEAESLRAQVKQALAELRAATAPTPANDASAATPAPSPRWFHFLRPRL